MLEGGEKPWVGGPRLREKPPDAAPAPTLQSTSACLTLPSTRPFTPPHPDFVPTRTGIPPSPISAKLLPAFHLIPTSIPPSLIFHNHNLSSVTPISSPPLPRLPSSSYPHPRLAQTSSPSLTIYPAYLHSYLFWIWLIFKREPSPASTPAAPSGCLLWHPPSHWWRAPSAGQRRISPGQILQLSLRRLCTRRSGTRCLPRQRAQDPTLPGYPWPSESRAKGANRSSSSQVRPREVREVDHSSGWAVFLTTWRPS